MDDDKRGDLASRRREQILNAASTCFARDGFHAATISSISREAGMSPGHIYHFFDNKDAIVIGIVERMAIGWLELIYPYPADGDLYAAVTERVAHAIAVRTDADFVRLWLEVLAAAARSESIAAAVAAADDRVRAAAREQIADIRHRRGITDEAPLDAVVDVVFALFEGLGNRSVVNPGLDRGAVEQVVQQATRAILES